MSPDPYSGSYDSANPQTMNRYSYVLNAPFSYLDPTGLVALATTSSCVTTTDMDGSFIWSKCGLNGPMDATTGWLWMEGNMGTNILGGGSGNAPNNGNYSYFKQWLKDVKSCFVDTGLGTIANQMDPFSPSASNAVQGAVDSASQAALAGAALHSVDRGLTVPLRSSIVRAGVGASEALGEASGWITIANLY